MNVFRTLYVIGVMFFVAFIDADLAFSACSSKKSANIEARAVSLRVLTTQLQSSPSLDSRSSSLLQLSGLTTIDGYVVDDANQDLILVGHVEPNAPPLHTEDFIVALRSAWHKYDSFRDNIYYYTAPGCSIDPDPKVIQKLQALGPQILKNSIASEKGAGMQEWDRICQEPQAVRVLGVPFDTHFARVMVDADYQLKRIVDGADTVDIPAFVSLTDMTLERIKSDLEQGKRSLNAFSSLNRFWFSPGKNTYEEASGIVWIKRSEVVLLTEEEALNRHGEIIGQRQADPLAKEFAEQFTARYLDAAERYPIYAELENLFRFVALAQILKFKSERSELKVDLAYFLEENPVPAVTVPRQLPGRSSTKGFTHHRVIDRGEQIAQVQLPSCGGVGIDIQVEETNFKQEIKKGLSTLRSGVLKSRPSNRTPFWTIPVSNVRRAWRIRRSNRVNKYSIRFTLEEHESGKFQLLGEQDRPNLEGGTGEELLDYHEIPSELLDRTLRETEGGTAPYDVYLGVNFKDEGKIAALATSLKLRGLPFTHVYRESEENSELSEWADKRGFVAEEESKLEDRNGLFTVILRLSHQDTTQVTLTVSSRIAQCLRDFRAKMQNNLKRSLGLLDSISLARHEMETKYGKEAIRAQMRDCVGNSLIIKIADDRKKVA